MGKRRRSSQPPARQQPPAPPAKKAGIQPVASITQSTAESATVIRQEASFHSGPIPSPETLAAYDRLQNGLAERIVAMAEAEQRQRHAMDQAAVEFDGKQQEILERAVDAEIDMKQRGQTFAIVAVILVVALAGFMVYKGSSTAAAGMVGTVLVGLVVAFITGQIKGSPETEEQALTTTDD